MLTVWDNLCLNLIADEIGSIINPFYKQRKWDPKRLSNLPNVTLLVRGRLGFEPWHHGNQFWIFIGRTDVEAETPILWPPDVKNWLIGEDPDARNDWRQEEKGTAEDEMVGWHYQLYGHDFEQAPGVGDAQGGLVCCSPWGRKESDMTERLNWSCISLNTHKTHKYLGKILVESVFSIYHHPLPLLSIT